MGACPRHDPKELEADSQPTDPRPLSTLEQQRPGCDLVLQQPAPGGPQAALTLTGAVWRGSTSTASPPPHPLAALCHPFSVSQPPLRPAAPP